MESIRKANLSGPIITAILLVMFMGCKSMKYKNTITEDFTKYVNPFVGTEGEGNTYPGAVAPFGLVQLSPDTDKKSWRAPSGYEYTDSTLYGFSMTHFNGTGVPDLGDFLFVPSTGIPETQAGTKEHPEEGYMTLFTHQDEKASPGYYSLIIPEHAVKVELTATQRAGMMRFTFPETDSANVLIDLSHVLKQKVVWAHVRIENNRLITGYHQVYGWAKERHLYFAARFSKPFEESRILNGGKYQNVDSYYFDSQYESSGQDIQCVARYKTKQNEPIVVKVGISAVSTQHAIENLDAEIPGWNFSGVVAQIREKWNTVLGKITIDGSQQEKETFYTSMYHLFLTPNIYQDVDDSYRGFDQNIHQAKGFTNYTVFSLWDTYRAVHPLFNLIESGRNADMVNSMLAHYDQSVDHLLPVWSFYNNENWCMIGYHSVSVIADACLKGLDGIDLERAYKAIKTTAMNADYDGLAAYDRLGYVPFDRERESVSKTLEYAYDDYCIAQLAKKLGKNGDYHYFMKRAMSYKNVFDPSTGYMRGKDSNGIWRVPFNPDHFEKAGDFTEASARQYSWYVPQDVQGLMNLMGGNEIFIRQLDALFDLSSKNEKENAHFDGNIGQYWHGNEPCHHVIYLYNYAGQPWKAQELVHLVMKTQYGNRPKSLCGNDDCGQMSAWYVFNILGFYPVCPVNGQYLIGSPCAKTATVCLSNGKVIKMQALNYSEKNIYIQSMRLNGKDWNKTYIPFDEIKNGGEIIYQMGPVPNKNWGTAKDSKPASIS